MNAQELLIAHGEKVLVVLATVSCGYFLYGTFTNEEIRPRGISMQVIDEKIKKVDNASQTQSAPVIASPSPYRDQMVARWGESLSPKQYISWLSAATDVGPPEEPQTYHSIYVIKPPKVTVSDFVGTMQITIEPPIPQSYEDSRISEEANKVWHLEGGDRADNTAQWVGFVVEQKIGKGDWQPLETKTIKNGEVAFSGDMSPIQITMQTPEPWQRYYFKARLVAKATGLPHDQATASNLEQSILVKQGDLGGEVNWDALTKALLSKEADVVKAALEPYQAGVKEGPFSRKLTGKESLYFSKDSKAASVLGTSSIRFVFERIYKDFLNPDNSGATFLLTKFIREVKGVDSKAGNWLRKPVQFKVLKNEGIGDPNATVEDPNKPPGTNIPEDLSTPFVLTEVRQGVKRILYWEIMPKSRPEGGKDKKLELNNKEIETEVAILTNVKTGSVVELPACEKIIKPNKPLSHFYPDFGNEKLINEAEDFKKNPASFKQRELMPQEPKMHNPGEGPLEALRQQTGERLLQTDTPYYELADGRLIYWDNFNHQLVVRILPGSDAEADKAAANAAADQATEEATPPEEPTDEDKPTP